ncbi:MAG: hypothetical protein EBT86_11935 [Actinobacteria bacterium]|nr:hypothetical protein [Actinomycetota bacterium]
MSHPDPLFDPENAYEDDDMMIEDENYDDYSDFHHGEIEAEDLEDSWDDSYDDSMDGDTESAFGSCGWGVDEYYEHYESGDDY